MTESCINLHSMPLMYVREWIVADVCRDDRYLTHLKLPLPTLSITFSCHFISSAQKVATHARVTLDAPWFASCVVLSAFTSVHISNDRARRPYQRCTSISVSESRLLARVAHTQHTGTQHISQDPTNQQRYFKLNQLCIYILSNSQPSHQLSIDGRLVQDHSLC
jgi:hypothetical protein